MIYSKRRPSWCHIQPRGCRVILLVDWGQLGRGKSTYPWISLFITSPEVSTTIQFASLTITTSPGSSHQPFHLQEVYIIGPQSQEDLAGDESWGFMPAGSISLVGYSISPPSCKSRPTSLSRCMQPTIRTTSSIRGIHISLICSCCG